MRLARVNTGEQGFTLVELLTVVGIIGVLAAVAVPQFASYRAKGFDRRAQLSLRHVAVAEEAYYVDYATYKNCDQSTCPGLLPGLGALSQGVVLQVNATASGFNATASHPSGTGQVFNW